MDANDFSDSAPGTLVSTIDKALAFVPDPLPTDLSLPNKTIRLLSRADNAVGRLDGTTSREFNPYLIGSPMLHREAILSSRMEGTITTPEQIVLFEAQAKRGLAAQEVDADTVEVANYIKAMRRGLDLLQELPVCLRMIREIHDTLLRGVRGESELPGRFRIDQNWIKGRLGREIQHARFVPPPVPEMKQALNDLEQYLNTEDSDQVDPLLVRLALIHYQFEAIHPFRDGNGRVGRLLIPLLLISHQRLDVPILYLSAFFERNRDDYQNLLLRVSQTGDWVSWVDFFLEGILVSAEEATQQSKALLKLRQNYHSRFQKGRSSALLIKLIDRLFYTPSITITDAAELLEITPQAASANIKKLVKEGILTERSGKQRYQVFIADEILGFMFDNPIQA